MAESESAKAEVEPEQEPEEDEDEDEDVGLSFTTRTLSEKLDSDISKAVRLEVALANFGSHWKGQITGGLGTTTGTQEYAEFADLLNDFLSHDWSASAKLKFVALCVEYNSLPAAIIAAVVSGIVGFLEIFMPGMRRMAGTGLVIAGDRLEVESAGYFGLMSGLLTFTFVFLFWQRIRKALAQKSIFVFMDKLCIHQTDAELKTKGILGLAGFIKISDRLVILWSPRYFTRLWCIYEIASWVKQRKPLRNIQILPLAEAAFVSSIFLAMCILCITLVWIARLEAFMYMGTFAAVSLFTLGFPLHIIRRAVAELRIIDEQLSTFEFAKAQSFCCAVDHVLPGTDIRIPCDREIIQQKLDDWFATKEVSMRASFSMMGNEVQTPVDRFNYYVQNNLTQQILQRCGRGRVKYLTSLIACTPGWCYITDRLHMLWVIDGLAAIRLLCFYIAVTFGVFPACVRGTLFLAVQMDRCVGVRPNPVLDVAVTILGSVVIGCILLLFVGGLNFALMEESSIYQIITLAATGLATVLMYRHDLMAWYYDAKGMLTPEEQKAKDEAKEVQKARISMTAMKDAEAEAEADLEEKIEHIEV